MLHLNRPKTKIPPYLLDKNIQNDHFLRSISSSFDFPALIALMGLWWAWNTYLVGILPTDFLAALGKRSLVKNNNDIESVLQESFEKFVKDIEQKIAKKEEEKST